MRIVKLMALMALFLFPSSVSQAGFVHPAPFIEPVVQSPRMLKFVMATNQRLAEHEAFFIASKLEEKAEKYDLHLPTFAAIIAQESRFRPGLKVCSDNNCDRGLGQISSIWVREWELDKERLRNDVDYNLDTSARLLRHLKDRHPKDPKVYSRYYNSRPALRKDYENRVERLIRLASR